ncbi:MAG: tRNA threonylcarbamoyladenosine dehydratase [Spirochaetes bacterium]|nr:MAG: tRNA threonylcarbamoyladenosine dehydratase [Spirochaetota bacterium]
MHQLYKSILHRSELVLGPEAMARVTGARVAVFGVGGVGSWCAEALARTGIRAITIVDSDIICPTNINRQSQATALNLGKSKVEEMRDRLLAINPDANITARHIAYGESTSGEFDLASFDYVIDAIDSLTNKILLLENCLAAGVTVYSSMGAGARSDASKIRTELITNTKNCPLARRVRKMLRDRTLTTDIVCVYSDELPVPPAVETMCGSGECACVHDRASFCETNDAGAVDWCGMKKQVNGALVHITAIFGLMLAGLVIADAGRTEQNAVCPTRSPD